MKRILASVILISFLAVQGFAQTGFTYLTSVFDDDQEILISLRVDKRHPTRNWVKFSAFIYRDEENNTLVFYEVDCDTFRYIEVAWVTEKKGETTLHKGSYIIRKAKPKTIMSGALLKVCGLPA